MEGLPSFARGMLVFHRWADKTMDFRYQCPVPAAVYISSNAIDSDSLVYADITPYYT